MANQKITFTPVNRIGEPCECCAQDRSPRAVRGVRVDVDGGDGRVGSLGLTGVTMYYCDRCIAQLAGAKAHP
jgi:hypothetical protein